jgi:O-methyltransferase domain
VLWLATRSRITSQRDLDLPDVVPSATAAASALGLAERSKALSGDFFTYVPEADIYLLKHILHDWNDAEAVRILKGCREAMRPGGRVIVIERLLGEIGEPGFAPLMDLHMMVMLTGHERTLPEYCGLLKDAVSVSPRALRSARKWRLLRQWPASSSVQHPHTAKTHFATGSSSTGGSPSPVTKARRSSSSRTRSGYFQSSTQRILPGL